MRETVWRIEELRSEDSCKSLCIIGKEGFADRALINVALSKGSSSQACSNAFVTKLPRTS